MNQDSLKNVLDRYSDNKDFIVVYTGRQSDKVDGIYDLEQKAIIINNVNFKNDNSVVYCGLHQLAHHVDFANNPNKKNIHNHTLDFKSLFFDMVLKAIDNGDFKTMDNPVVRDLQSMNKEYVSFMKRYGSKLIDCKGKCIDIGYPFEDITDRVLQLSSSESDNMMRFFVQDIPEDISPEIARNIVKIKDPKIVNEVIQTKKVAKVKPEKDPVDEETFLMQEKARLEKKIQKEQERLQEIEDQLQGIEDARELEKDER